MAVDFFAFAVHQFGQFVYARFHFQSFLQTPFLEAIDVGSGCLLICGAALDSRDYSLNSFPLCK